MLDLDKLAPRMQQLVASRSEQLRTVAQHGAEAFARLAEAAAQRHSLMEKIDQSRTSWMVAGLVEDPDARFPPPPCPISHSVVATDGSQIAADRHEASYCAVLNVGEVLLRYGPDARARLVSEPQLIFEEDELEAEIGRGRLEHKRASVESEALAALVAECGEDGRPSVALSDGTLILWGLETEDPEYRSSILERFAALFDVAQHHRVPVVGYISRPGSRDVVNALRVLRCPFEPADCERRCSGHKGRFRATAPCAGVEMSTDGLLLGRHLAPSERSALFATRSKIMREYPTEHAIRFCYLNTGSEVVRLEVPAWVAEEPALMNLVHAVCLDQTRKGQGYPRALTEAHELAVVRGPDRARFYEVLEGMMVRARLPVAVTRKALAKRTRSI